MGSAPVFTLKAGSDFTEFLFIIFQVTVFQSIEN